MQTGKMATVTTLPEAIAADAARLIVEEGLSYGAAKARARDNLGASRRCALPGNDQVEVQVRDYIALFYADTQGAELAALRRLALVWMDRLEAFRPHIAGAVWNGTATRLSDIHLQLFCDDMKSAELLLVNHAVRYATQSTPGARGGRVDTLSFTSRSDELAEDIGIHLAVRDYDDMRGVLKPRTNGHALLGSRNALAERLAQDSS